MGGGEDGRIGMVEQGGQELYKLIQLPPKMLAELLKVHAQGSHWIGCVAGRTWRIGTGQHMNWVSSMGEL